LERKTRNFSIVGIVLLSVIVGLAIVSFGQSTGIGPMSKLAVYAAGIPDSYGNRIYAFSVWQNATGTWTTATTVTYAAFTNGTTLSIPANVKTILEVSVLLNYSMAPDLATASGRARVYLTITGVYTSAAMIYSGGMPYPGGGPYTHWYLAYQYPATTASPTSVWTPATDTTYSTSVLYQAYY